MSVALALLLLAGVAGAVVAKALRLPAWSMIGPLLGAAALSTLTRFSPDVPAAWSTLGQVLVGVAVGAAVAPRLMAQFRAVVAPGSVAVVSVVGVGVLCGVLLATTGLADPTVAALGTVPGGVGEMVAAAEALEADSAAVAGIHVLRIVVVLWTLPLLVRWITRSSRGRDEGA